MDLTGLKPSLTELTDDEVTQLLLGLRQDRRERAKKPVKRVAAKRRRKLAIDADKPLNVKALPSDLKQALLKMLLEEKD